MTRWLTALDMVGLALSLLGGCATAPQLTPIGKGAPVAMVVVKSPQVEALVNIR